MQMRLCKKGPARDLAPYVDHLILEAECTRLEIGSGVRIESGIELPSEAKQIGKQRRAKQS